MFVIDDCKLINTANKTRTKKLPDKLQYAFVFLGLGVMARVSRVSRVRVSRVSV